MNSDDPQIPKPELTSDPAAETNPDSIVPSVEPPSEPNESPSTSTVSKSTTDEEEAIKPINADSENVSKSPSTLTNQVEDLRSQLQSLAHQKQTLTTEINHLQQRKTQILAEQLQDIEQTVRQMIQEGLKELEQQKQTLEISIEQLERRRERIKEEMRTTFAGVSQDLAIRVQGFKDYLVGSLQDLAAAAEQLELPTGDSWSSTPEPIAPQPSSATSPVGIPLATSEFEGQTRKIQRILEQYRNSPDYYGPPWQLRRTFEPIHAERVQNWFFSQGGRGAIRSMGTRLQNILIASAVISVLNSLHGDRSRFLILANSPERLGEWRRGLQDCLGISRSDFGPERGVVLFESPDALVLKAERLIEDKFLPLVIIDETEEQIDLSLLQFPLWLAFAPDPQQMSSYLY